MFFSPLSASIGFANAQHNIEEAVSAKAGIAGFFAVGIDAAPKQLYTSGLLTYLYLNMPNTNLSPEIKKQLKSRAALLNPVVMIGNKGLSAAVDNEIEQALNAHELIKIRFLNNDRAWQKETAATICESHQATLIQAIGHIIVIYRPQQE